MRRAGWVAAAAVVGWYVLALAILHPLTDAPVVDSWLYGSAVRRFLRTGEIRFAGFTQAMPIAQVVYGVVWSRAFGANSVSLEISVVTLAVLCGVMFHALAIRCGASRWQALAATGLLVCNPCFTFLSFSFMTEIPFLTALIAAHLAFARAAGRREDLWLWLAAALAVIAFMIRVFGAMAIAGCAGAILLYDARWLPASRRPGRARWLSRLSINHSLFPLSYLPRKRAGEKIAERSQFSRRVLGSDSRKASSSAFSQHPARTMAPFGVALLVCALLFWLGPKPWALQLGESNLLHYLFRVPLANYLRAGVLNPVLYLGMVLSPLALLHLTTPRWRQVAIGGAGIFAAALILMQMDNRLPVTPECSCFGGWSNVLILRGGSSRFSWDGDWQYAFLTLASFGAAGLIAAFADVCRTLSRAAAAIVIAAAVYWAATIPLWFYNDRYYLVMVPAGAIVLALAPLPKGRMVKGVALAMTLAMGLMSLGGTYAYQRGMAVILATRNELEREGVKRSAIDAGYALNGEDLYRYPKHGIETMELEAGIPMITSEALAEYTIASEPDIEGTQLVRRLKYPGLFGLGHRYLYLVKKRAAGGIGGNPPHTPPAASPPRN